MKKVLITLALLVLTVFLTAQNRNLNTAAKITFTANDINGKNITNEIFENNKVTMLNIWGTFCGPCIREMPDLAKLSEANKNNEVEVVGIIIDILDRKGNVDSRIKSDAQTIIKKTGASYTHIIPSIEMMTGLLRNVQVVPTTIFVDSNGKQIGDAFFGSRSQKDWQKIIDDLLKNEIK